MRYLFIDVECSNGKDICEFGYVLTDADFNIIDKSCFIINPEAKFNLIGRERSVDIKLYYPEDVYYKSPKFPYYYKEIKNLIEHPNQFVIGHAISNDVNYINNACKRFRLGSIDYSFYDSQVLMKEYYGLKNRVSLESAGEIINIEVPNFFIRVMKMLN